MLRYIKRIWRAFRISRMNAWDADCMKWRGHLLRGKHAHWCWDWDLLPVDETCPEWPCGCTHTTLE